MRNFFRIDFNPNRVYGLDILRALAILFVIIGHGGYFLPPKAQTINSFFVFDGVSIFFVLSGFLIGGILIKNLENKTINKRLLLDFWIRRWFRTLPNYLFILVIVTALNVLFTDGFSINYIKRYFIFSQNLFYQHPSFFPEAWSLSVEEWFYLLIPVIIFSSILFVKITAKHSV